MNKQILLLFLMALISYIVLDSCKEPAKVSDVQIRTHLSSDPGLINPLLATTAEAYKITALTTLSLADYDPITLDLQPLLIRHIPTITQIDDNIHNGYFIEIQLNDGIFWPNGRVISAQDVLFTYQMIFLKGINNLSWSQALSFIKDVQIIDSLTNTLRIYFDDNNRQNLDLALAIPILPFDHYDQANLSEKYSFEQILIGDHSILRDPNVNKFIAKFNEGEFDKNGPVGCGPYQIKTWEKNKFILLERKKKHPKGLLSNNPYITAKPQEIYFAIIPEVATAFSMLLAGNLDVMDVDNIPMSQIENLSKQDKFSSQFDLIDIPSYSNKLLILNHCRPLLKLKEVRIALDHLVDVDGLIREFEYDKADKIYSPINPSMNFFEKQEDRSFNPQLALQLLQKLGAEDTNGDGILEILVADQNLPVQFDFFVPQNSALVKTLALRMQTEAQKIGIKINLISKSFGKIIEENVLTKDFDIVPFGMTMAPNTLDFYQGWHSSTSTIPSENYTCYANNEMDKLLQNLKTASNPKDIDLLLHKFQSLIHEDAANIYLYSPHKKFVKQKDWQGVFSAYRPEIFLNTFSKR